MEDNNTNKSNGAVIALAVLVVVLSLLIIVIIVLCCLWRKRNKKRKYLKKICENEKMSLLKPDDTDNREIWSSVSPTDINVVIYGLNYPDMKQIEMTIPVSRQYIMYIYDDYNADVMKSIYDCKVVLMIHHIQEANMEKYEFMYQLMQTHGKAIIPLVITPDGSMYNDKIENILKHNKYLRKYTDLKKMNSKEICTTVTEILDNPPIESPDFPEREIMNQRVIYMANCKTYGVFIQFKQLLEHKMPNYRLVPDSHSDGKKYKMMDCINNADAVFFFCFGMLNICLHHILMYEYSQRENKLIIPMFVNYKEHNAHKLTKKLKEENKYSQFIELDNVKENGDLEKLATDTVSIIDNYLQDKDSGITENKK